MQQIIGEKEIPLPLDISIGKGIYLVMIASAHCVQQCNGHDRSHQFCCHDRYPDAVDFPKQRKDQYRRHLKYERSQKREQRRQKPVVQRGKKSRSENRGSCEQERKRENIKSTQCQR